MLSLYETAEEKNKMKASARSYRAFSFWEGVQKPFGLKTGNHYLTQLIGFATRMCFCGSVYVYVDAMNERDILEGFQAYSGHPRISLFLLFSASSH